MELFFKITYFMKMVKHLNIRERDEIKTLDYYPIPCAAVWVRRQLGCERVNSNFCSNESLLGLHSIEILVDSLSSEKIGRNQRRRNGKKNEKAVD